MIKARKLNQEGLFQFAEHISDLHASPGFEEPFDQEVLFDEHTSTAIDFSVELDPEKRFENLWEFAAYLSEKIGPKNDLFNSENNGFFAWIAALYFDQIRKKKPRALPAYICSTQLVELDIPGKSIFNLDYRHVVRGSLRLLRKPNIKPDLAKNILSDSPINEWTDLPENFCGRLNKPHLSIDVIQEFILANYFDNDGIRKDNATSKDQRGTIRRLAKPVLPRLVNVMDVAALDADKLKLAWGKEFKDSDFA
jgi:hypothetical protein